MKISRIIFIIAIITVVIGTFSCKGTGEDNKSGESSTQVDTLWNDDIQTVFFDTPFGASRQEVVNNFARHGFYLRNYSTKDFLPFYSQKGQYFEFGGMTWENLDVTLKNGKFYTIRFYYPYKDKSQALNNFEGIANALAKKYKLTNFYPNDSTVLINRRAYGRNSCRASASCYRYESVSHETFYASQLSYTDEDIENEDIEVSNEL